jgi:hypothetical protein
MGIVLPRNKKPIKAHGSTPCGLRQDFAFFFSFVAHAPSAGPRPAVTFISLLRPRRLFHLEFIHDQKQNLAERRSDSEGETSMVAIASLRSVLSAIRRKLTRGFKKIFLKACESQMRKAQLEIERYYRGRRFLERDDHASTFESVSIPHDQGCCGEQSLAGHLREAIAGPIVREVHEETAGCP